jgi:hypothetical protein
MSGQGDSDSNQGRNVREVAFVIMSSAFLFIGQPAYADSKPLTEADIKTLDSLERKSLGLLKEINAIEGSTYDETLHECYSNIYEVLTDVHDYFSEDNTIASIYVQMIYPPDRAVVGLSLLTATKFTLKVVSLGLDRVNSQIGVCGTNSGFVGEARAAKAILQEIEGTIDGIHGRLTG